MSGRKGTETLAQTPAGRKAKVWPDDERGATGSEVSREKRAGQNGPELIKPGMANEDTLTLAERLAKHPELKAQEAALLDEVENRAGALGTADAAEDALIARVRQMGRASLTAWAERRHAQLNAAAPAQARRSAKKNSAG
jgi:hypothetical protein